MKQEQFFQEIVLVSALLLAALFLLPAAMVVPFQTTTAEENHKLLSEKENAPEFSSGVGTGVRDQSRMLRVLLGEQTVEMPLDAYLFGVTAAEMPASFEPEALKAQAVAARTYTLYQMRGGGRHGAEADICTDSACCQAYIDPEEARGNWGENADTYQQKIREAVTSTDGQVILYGEEPILAVFHAASAGKTRRAGEVWSSDLPYLQAVSSPEAAANIPNYYSQAVFAPAEFRERVLAVCPEAKLSGGVETWLQHAVTDEAGNVETVEVGGIVLKGGTLRSLLELRSACFEWEVQEGQLVFFVTGYGHGVGLSQYGANAMAGSGADYREILTHYYTGVRIENWADQDG